jgi:hypothetical protein
MKQVPWPGAAVAVLLFAAAPALAGHHNCCCEEPAPVVLRAEVIQRVEKVCVTSKPAPVVRRAEGVRDVPFTRCVPVCVTDPCTGCTHTEYKQETVVERVKTLTIEILPPPPCAPKTEERVKSCVTITIDHLPAAPCAH